MEQALLDDLLQSLKEAKAIAQGQAPASRRFNITPPDVMMVREQSLITTSDITLKTLNS